MKMNHHYGELKASYLFVDIAHRVAAYQEAHPEKGDHPPGHRRCDPASGKSAWSGQAMQDAAAEMGTKEGFHGYGPEQGYPFQAGHSGLLRRPRHQAG